MEVKTNYGKLKLRDGEYLPDTGAEYPIDNPFASLVPSVQLREVKFDDSYPYLDRSFSFKLQNLLAYFLVFGPYYLINRLVYGVRFEGRNILRKYRKEFETGIVSVANHCYRWDGMAIAEALGHRLWIPMLKTHFTGKDAWNLRYFGGIPVPEDFGGLRKFNEAFDTLNSEGAWIHVFAESRNWHFYKPVRPFKKGAFTMAYKYNVPILPIAIAYRERKGFYRLTGKKELPLITVRIGEPIFPDRSKPRKEEVADLLAKTHSAICELAGITENPWPAEFNED